MLRVAGVETWKGANVGKGEARQQDARLGRPRGRDQGKLVAIMLVKTKSGNKPSIRTACGS